MISSIAWVRRGAAARVPRTEGALDEGLGHGLEEATLEDHAAAAWDGKQSKAATKKKAAAAAEPSESSKAAGKRTVSGAHRGHPEDDPSSSDEDDQGGLSALTTGNLMYYGSNKDDPNITLKEDEDLDSEVDDYEIGDTDLVLLGARSDEQVSSLEAYVYEEPQDNLYPHHDVPLPVFPLCVAWFDFRPGGGSGKAGGRGNFAAVGTFAPYIEVWDLDVLDALEPEAILGAAAAAALEEEQFTSHAAEALAASERQRNGNQTRAEKRSKKKKKKVLGGGDGASGGSDAPQGHKDAVMCLAWNQLQPNCLASGSADTTVRLWDLEGSCDGSLSAFTHHRDKVQALAWHPTDAPTLLTAGFDRRACVVDVRVADGAVREWELSADAEKVCWSPDGTSFLASTEDGLVRCFDVRTASSSAKAHKAKPLWSLQAHKAACTGLDFCPAAPGVLATGGQDRMLKLWAVGASGSAEAPSMIAKRNLQLGGLFDISFSRDSPALLAAGGSKGKLGIWNTLEVEEMQQRMPTAQAPLGEDGRVLSGAVAGMGSLEVNSSDEEEEDGEGEGGERMEEAGGASSAGAAKAKKKAGMREYEEGQDDEDGDDDEDDEDDDDDDEDDDDEAAEERDGEELQVVEEGDGGRAAVAARVAAAAAAASKKARRSKAQSKIKVKRPSGRK